MFARFIAAAAVVLTMSAPVLAADTGNLQIFRNV